MSTGGRYEWIVKKPVPAEPKRWHDDEPPCARCGYHPVGDRKRCPACLTYKNPEAGHLGALEQYVWVVFLLVFFVLLVRLVGVAW